MSISNSRAVPFGPQPEDFSAYYVVLLGDAGLPSVHSFSTVEELSAFLTSKIGKACWWGIFRGEAWHTTKGNVKKLVAPDGRFWVLNPYELSDEPDLGSLSDPIIAP